MTESHTFLVTVLEDRLDEALLALQKAARKAARYGSGDISVAVAEHRTEMRRGESGRDYRERLVDLLVTGPAPRVGDHVLVARVEPTPEGCLIDAVPGETVPEQYRTTDAHCDHCGKTRARNEVYVVRDGAGQHMQVGRNCLRDHLGIDSPAAIAQRFEFYHSAGATESEYRRSQWFQTTEELLTAASAAIRVWGWVPRSAQTGEPTSMRVALLWSRALNKYELEDRAKLVAAMDDTAREEARAARRWLLEEAPLGDGDYVHNLRILLARDDLYDPRRVGIVVSAVAAHQRHLGRLEIQRREREEAKASHHIGTEGERLRALLVRVDKAHGYNSQFGEGVIYKMSTEDGAILTWMTAPRDLSVGSRYRVDATVKRHGEYREIPETQVTRVTILEKVPA